MPHVKKNDKKKMFFRFISTRNLHYHYEFMTNNLLALLANIKFLVLSCVIAKIKLKTNLEYVKYVDLLRSSLESTCKTLIYCENIHLVIDVVYVRIKAALHRYNAFIYSHTKLQSMWCMYIHFNSINKSYWLVFCVCETEMQKKKHGHG